MASYAQTYRWRSLQLALCSVFVAAAVPALAEPFRVAGHRREYATLAQAVAAIGDTDANVWIAPGRYRDCAVQTAGYIGYRAARPLSVIFEGGMCEGKATLVLRGRGALVDGIIFQGARVPDGNGAGVRLERGRLSVRKSWFRDSEQGILGGDDPASAIDIDQSTFAGLGRCDRGLSCAHSIYIGQFRSLKIRRSRFERGRGGHYIKSRALMIDISDSSFDDSRGRATNYMIDLPNGGQGRIERNIFVQGSNKENHSAFIAISAEDRQSGARLSIAQNRATMAPTANWPTSFVANWSKSPLRMSANVVDPPIANEPAAAGQVPFWTAIRHRLGYYREKLGRWLAD